MICRGLCACTEMLWMCVLYVSFGSEVRRRTVGCVAMGSSLLFIVQIARTFSRVWCEQSASCFVSLFYHFYQLADEDEHRLGPSINPH